MTEQRQLLYINGQYVAENDASLSALDRGFTLGDGLFETMVARGTGVFRSHVHLSRLRRGASILHLPTPRTKALADAVSDTLRHNGHTWALVRLSISRGSHLERGLDVPRGISPTVVIRVTPWEGPPTELPLGHQLAISSMRRNDLSPISRIKSLAYVEGVVARMEARRLGADDALICNTRGFVACASSSNLFIILDGILITPPVEDGALPGVARQTILEEASHLGIICQERSLLVEEVAGAEECFLTNVVTGPVPITTLAGRPVGNGVPGTLMTRLGEVYWRRVKAGLFSQTLR